MNVSVEHPESTEAVAAALPSAAVGRVLDLTQMLIERALRQRERYRYVRPSVVREGAGFRIESPCCSRKIDPHGGVIDIALLMPLQPASARRGRAPHVRGWTLLKRDHARQQWVPQQQSLHLAELLQALCEDSHRVFWP